MPEHTPELNVESRRDLAKNMREICRRLNANPDIARLLLVNPIYVLEDLGVRFNQEMRDHVYNTFHNPPARERRTAELETELKAELERITGRPEIPVSPEHRAELLFTHLKLPPLGQEAAHPARLEPGRLRAYGPQHPLVVRLLEYDAVRKGGLTFHPRSTYEAYKRGDRKQCWLDSITFKV
jgi:hypothetical protein